MAQASWLKRLGAYPALDENVIREELISSHGSEREGLPEAGRCVRWLEAVIGQEVRETCAAVLEECRPLLYHTEGGQGRAFRRQEVPLHWEREHSRQDPEGNGGVNEDEAYNHHPPELPPLHQEVPPLREAPQHDVGALLAGLRLQGR